MDIYALLNINKAVLQDFPLQADRAVDHQTELAINRSMRTLKEIEERMMSDNGVKVSQQSIDEIIQKVIDNAKENNKDNNIWSIRELRIVSYYLIKLQGNEGAYEYALGLLDRNWRDMFFNGLSFYCLDQWNLIDPPLRMQTCELLRNKLRNYTDGNKKYMAMKNHSNMFEEVGPKRLSALLSQKKEDVKNAPAYFNNKPSTLNQSYYSDVIVNFCESNNIMDLDYIEEIFEVHNIDRTKKLVLADLVARVNDHGNDMKRTMLCKFASRMLGDITLGSTWAPFSGATEKDAQKLKKAKQLVNLWFNQKIIETFFEVCVQDRDRKIFWLKYVDRLSGFRIVGSTATKRLLQSDSRISGIFLPYFIETDSYTSQTAALVLFIKNKMLVEFSDTGALYAYDQNHRMVNLVTKQKRDITSTADLKIPSMNNLIQITDWGSNYFYEEGRMTHQGHWQGRLSSWLTQIVFSSNNTGISFFDTKDNDLFKAKPVEKKEFKPSPKPRVPRSLFDDVPEYEAKPKVQQPSNRPQTVSPNKPRQAPMPTKAVYETNIRSEIASKWFFNDKCRIIANSKGYYVNIYRGQKYVLVRNMVPGTRTSGTSIWIKRPNPNGWSPIVHAVSGREIAVGFIKEAGGGLMFKQNLSLSDFLRINLY